MNLTETLALEGLKSEEHQNSLERKALDSKQMTSEVFRIAASEGREIDETKKKWASTNLTSTTFRLVEIFVNRVANPHRMNSNRIQAVMASSFSDSFPIVVDFNKDGKAHVASLRFTPRAIVIDGSEKFAALNLKGISRVKAWVGDKVFDQIHACSSTCRCATQAAKDSESGCSIKSCGMKFTKAGSTSTLKEIHSLYNKHIEGSSGGRSRIAAVAPPIFEKTVKHMKKHKDIDNPYALSWWMYNNGYRPRK